MEIVKQILERILASPIAAEIFLRGFIVLFMAEGMRYTVNLILKKESRAAVVMSIIVNILAGIWMTHTYATNHDLSTIIFTGCAYGFGTLFVHGLWVKYKLGKKLLSVLPTISFKKKV